MEFAVPYIMPVPFEHPRLTKAGVELAIKYLDQAHPSISGNKFFKLKYNLQAARVQGHTRLLSFGGAFSNHIYALAHAAEAYGFEAIGIIRGERSEPLNPTLQVAEQKGMKLHFVSREAYRKKTEEDFIRNLQQDWGDFYLIPEGGSNAFAVKGCAEILSPEDNAYDFALVACGTGGTVAGLINTPNRKSKILGIPVLKGGFIKEAIQPYLLPDVSHYDIIEGYHGGGYAKVSLELLAGIKEMDALGLRLDPVYTAKAFFALLDLAEKGYFPRGSKILFIHTGGLQGRAGFGI
ncbi:pyridoxal-phosphate dependent enzyme [Cytophagales bacterium LB-30]|uniref:Pyridoxal-phosphate dependent enzyme n=1 Tax=Shiella aurantiaca TaxID=3058365 RepID=A0ABT8F9B3_9BACT|nr:pyridoxal-phosphate dependent enzyme [Shiella aurantiaca]MDN4166844.1 pyridoxal-phosphate dependent enzyme [Shiella aurantiaca]